MYGSWEGVKYVALRNVQQFLMYGCNYLLSIVGIASEAASLIATFMFEGATIENLGFMGEVAYCVDAMTEIQLHLLHILALF